MSSVEYLRDFVNERLTAAAEEIFGVFKKTIVEYEEEIDRQRKLLDTLWKPDTKLELQQHVCTEEEVLTDQEKNSSLDQEDPEPPQIKEEEEELCISQDGAQLALKQETDTFMFIPPLEESDDSETEVESDQELLSHNFYAAESQDEKGSEHGDSGAARDAEPKPKKRHYAHTAKKPFRCDTCLKSFRYKSHFNYHLRVHTGERPYLCNTCGKRFKVNSALISHIRIHTGDKPYSCKTCGQVFRLRKDLLMHKRMHTGENPYSCNTCGKGFRGSRNLVIHMRVHTGEKPFLCQICEKRFRQKSTLNTHMRVHKGERPYLCNTCGKRFNHTSTLNKHVRLHSGEKPLSCSKDSQSESGVERSFESPLRKGDDNVSVVK